jgi:proline dehydrogenase
VSLFDTLIRTTLPITPRPVVGFFARRYVAGDTLDEATSVVRRLAEQRYCATIDVLGEDVTEPEQARAVVAEYHQVIAAIAEHSLDANVSLKPTQLGLSIDPALCRDSIEAVVSEASKHGVFVRIDMEDSATTDATLRIYHELIARYPKGAGVVLQARLRRTLADAATLAASQANVRLCKGIYLEPRRIAYQEREIIRNAYMHALRALLTGGSYVGIATHDEWLVCESLALVRELGLRCDQYEFQMLLGVDPELRRVIVESGRRLRVYVPFGTHWYPYSVRRLRENPTIARAGLHALLRGRLEK